MECLLILILNFKRWDGDIKGCMVWDSLRRVFFLLVFSIGLRIILLIWILGFGVMV